MNLEEDKKILNLLKKNGFYLKKYEDQNASYYIRELPLKDTTLSKEDYFNSDIENKENLKSIFEYISLKELRKEEKREDLSGYFQMSFPEGFEEECVIFDNLKNNYEKIHLEEVLKISMNNEDAEKILKILTNENSKELKGKSKKQNEPSL